MLTSPYKSYDPDTLVKLTALVPPEVKATINAVCVNRGFHNAAISLFYQALCADIKQLNTEIYDPDNERQLLEFVRCRTNLDLTRKAPDPNDGEGIEEIPGTSNNAKTKRANTPSKSKGGSRTKATKKVQTNH